eukprot:m.117239 g.117239  ORF g.117239 m.117239 type:complete len:751 (-) comp13625_c0_seq5:2841-5093(-)
MTDLMAGMMDDNLWEKTTKEIFGTLDSLLDPTKSTPYRKWTYLFGDVHKLCHATPEPFSAQLHTALQEYLEESLRKVCEELRSKEEFLKAYSQRFTFYSVAIESINSAFRSLNQEMPDPLDVLGDPQATPLHQHVYSLGMKTWHNIVFKPLERIIFQQYLTQLEQFRSTDSEGDTATLRTVTDSFARMSCFKPMDKMDAIYTQDFEPAVLRAASTFYSVFHKDRVEQLTFHDYVLQAAAQLEREEDIGLRVLQTATQAKLKCIAVESTLAQIPISTALKECAVKRQDDLARKYFDSIQCLDHCVSDYGEQLRRHVETLGVEQLNELQSRDELTPPSYAACVISIIRDFEEQLANVYLADKVIQSHLSKAFDTIVNYNPLRTGTSKMAELLAKTADMVLKRSKATEDGEQTTEQKLKDTITIFRFIQDKDVFKKFYSKLLARRLLHSNSTDEHESMMISSLKAQCGFDYTQHFQKMFSDVAVSRDLGDAFRSYIEGMKTVAVATEGAVGTSSTVGLSTRFTAQVLQSGAWPLSASKALELTLPPIFSDTLSAYETYYMDRHQGRKLTWLFHLSTGDIRGKFGKRQVEFHATLAQMAMLLMYQTDTVHHFTTLAERTGMKETDARAIVKSLEKCHLLKETSPDMYTISVKYPGRKTRIRITAAVQKESQSEVAATHLAIEEDRRLYIQAVLVRIMKARKSCQYTLLIKEAIDQSRARFAPSVRLIKQAIDELIDKGYMERKEGDKQLLFYIA